MLVQFPTAVRAFLLLWLLFLSLQSTPSSSSSFYHKTTTSKTTTEKTTMASTTIPCAEIVTFRLKEGVSPSQFQSFAKETLPVLQEFGGCLSRSLTVDTKTDLWTDYILWKDLETALKAAEHIPNDPRFADFGNAIDPESVAMRHDRVEMFWKGKNDNE